MSCGSPEADRNRRVFVDLIDVLRCPALHPEEPLVAVAALTIDRQLVEGVLGCPMCGAEYPVRDGAVWFGLGRADRWSPSEVVVSGDPDEVIRLAAQLGIDGRGGRYLFDGAWSSMVAALGEIGPLLALGLDSAMPGLSVLRDCADRLPVAAGRFRGAVLARPAAALAAAAARALETAGRLVAPAATPVPDGVTVLARDARQWVATRDASLVVAARVVLRRA